MNAPIVLWRCRWPDGEPSGGGESWMVEKPQPPPHVTRTEWRALPVADFYALLAVAKAAENYIEDLKTNGWAEAGENHADAIRRALSASSPLPTPTR